MPDQLVAPLLQGDGGDEVKARAIARERDCQDGRTRAWMRAHAGGTMDGAKPRAPKGAYAGEHSVIACLLLRFVLCLFFRLSFA